MMKIKRLGILVLALTTILVVSGCNKSETTDTNTTVAKVDTQAYDILKGATNKLNSVTDTKTYASAVYINGVQDTVWLNFVLKDYNYTVYPVDEKGNFVTAAGVKEDTKYVMTDYSDTENAYVLVEDEKFASLNYDSNKVLDNRKDMFMSYMLDKFTVLEVDDMQVDKDGAVIEVYKATLPAEYVPNIVSNGNYALFANYADKVQDEKSKKFVSLYSDYLGRLYLCNDATVYMYVSSGDLLGVEIEYSGAGVVNTYSMFVTSTKVEVKEPLDKSKVTADYTADFSQYGTMLGDATTYEEGMEALDLMNNINNATQSTQEETTKQQESTTQSDASLETK